MPIGLRKCLSRPEKEPDGPRRARQTGGWRGTCGQTNFGLRLVRNSRGSVAVNDGRKQGLPVNYEKCRVLKGAWRR